VAALLAFLERCGLDRRSAARPLAGYSKGMRQKESGTRAGILKAGRLVSQIDTRRLGVADLELLYLEHMHAALPTGEAAA
jgi:hypothetical protein